MRLKGLTMGLRERIASAKSASEVDALLVEASQYKQASVRTQNAWASTASRRKDELANQRKSDSAKEDKRASTTEVKGDQKNKKHRNAKN